MLFILSMEPSLFKIPQCPCEVYGHKHTSQAIVNVGNHFLNLGNAFITGLIELSACVPFSSCI